MRPWLGLSVAVLALAGTLALLVALARTPAVRPSVSSSYFYAALVGHVDLLQVIWYLVMPVLFWRHLGLVGGKGERLSFLLMTVGIAGIVLASVTGQGQPVLAQYLPFIINPLFLGGTLLFLAGVGVAAGQAAPQFRRGASPLARAGGAAAASVLASIATMVIIGMRAAFGTDATWEQNLVLVAWVGGHVLQFAHVANMLAVWGLLLGESGGREQGVRRLLSVVHLCPAGAVLGLAAAAALPIALLEGPALMMPLKTYVLGLPAALGLFLAAPLWWESRGRRPEGRSWRGAAGAGLVVMAVGGLLALLFDLSRQTTVIPAHYHSVLTAPALAFMGLTYFLFHREGVRLPWPRWAGLQPYLYGLGMAALVAGMAWAGLNDAPRKTFGTAFANGDPGLLMALNLWGLGAVLSVAGGAAYLLNVFPAVLRWSRVRGEATSDRIMKG